MTRHLVHIHILLASFNLSYIIFMIIINLPETSFGFYCIARLVCNDNRLTYAVQFFFFSIYFPYRTHLNLYLS